MSDSDLDLVSQRIPTVLGSLEIALPAGAALLADPGAVEGSGWYWSPQPGAVLTVSDGEAGPRTAASLLTLERSLDNTTVVVIRDETGEADGVDQLEFLSTPTPSRTFIDDGGHGHPASGDEAQTRGRFRFWQRDGSAVRVGYRLDEPGAAEWRATLDRILDAARLG